MPTQDPTDASFMSTPMPAGLTGPSTAIGLIQCQRRATGVDARQAFHQHSRRQIPHHPTQQTENEDRQQQAGTGNTHVYRYRVGRSEEHTSELQSLMRISYAVFCLKKKKKNKTLRIKRNKRNNNTT